MTEVLTSANRGASHRAEFGWRNGPAVSERLMRLSPDRMMKRGHDVELAASIRKWRAAMEHYAGIAGMGFDGAFKAEAVRGAGSAPRCGTLRGETVVVSAASGTVGSSLGKSPNWQAVVRWPLLEMKQSLGGAARSGSIRE